MNKKNSPIKGGSSPKIRCNFIHSPDPLYEDNQLYGVKFMPVWAYTLAGHIPNDGRFELCLYDMRIVDVDDVQKGDVFLFSGINQDLSKIKSLNEQFKQKYPKSLSMLGGPICWSFDQAGDIEKLDFIDVIVIGDGEDIIGNLLDEFQHGKKIESIVRVEKRFDLENSLPFYDPFVKNTIDQYYGAVVEVSRGCPFLCEFCDIRILPDNNRTHQKPTAKIIAEIEHLCSLGVNKILLACDNFIGDPNLAQEVVDGLLQWRTKVDYKPSFYTWTTINLQNYPTLMKKMRLLGFDMLFIGIESFNTNSLLETAKTQNSAVGMVEVIRDIQSYGFLVVAGLIFGFDSDDESCFEITKKGLLESGLISGDPSLLTALPGTPLYRRMKLSGRLRPVGFGLGGYKYQTNIKYLMDKHKLIHGFQQFVDGYCQAKYQFERFEYLIQILKGDNYQPLDVKGYGDIAQFSRMIFGNWKALKQMAKRLFIFAANPINLYYVFRGWLLILSNRQIKDGFNYFQFWVFAWTNAILKYKTLSTKDFDIDSVDDGFDINNLIPEGYQETADEKIPQNKIDAQVRATTKQLEKIVLNG
ncbi:MAG: radical SAM protein [Magnetococcales bacterium]|nr:radical SAM protein [Magnetococcales bacterium]